MLSLSADQSGLLLPPRHPWTGACLLWPLLVLLLASVPRSSEGDEPQMGGLLAPAEGEDRLLGLEMGYEAIEERDFFGLLLLGSYRDDQLRLGLGLPLRLDLDSGELRPEDWDEAADCSRVLRFLEYGEAGEVLHLRLGELASVSLGHGTLLNQYFGVVDPDRHRAGLWADAALGPAGVEALVDNLAGPSLLGGRVQLGPDLLWSPGSFMGHLSFGLSLVADLSAPMSLALGCPAGSVPDTAPCPGQEILRSDSAGGPLAAREGALVLVGIDTAIDLVRRPGFRTLSYLDINGIIDHGGGLHLGLLLRARPIDQVHGSLRLEYRYAGPGYRPAYVNTFYEIDRWGLAGVPKASSLDESVPGHGFYGELALGVDGLFSVAALYEQLASEPGGALGLRAEVPGPGPLRAGVFYCRQSIDRPGSMLGMDGSFLVTELRAQLTPLLYLGAHYSRLWRFRSKASAARPFASIHVWGLGAGLSAAF